MSKSVIVIGASSAIGKLVVDKFILEGWSVVAYCNKNNPFSGKQYKKSNIEVIKIDLQDIGQLEKHLSKSNFSNISSFINCAGKIFPLRYSESSYELIINSLKVNSISATLFIQKLLPLMIKNNYGRIVQLGSIGVKYGGGINNYPYSLAKHLLEFFPLEIKQATRYNVLCNTVRVGFVDTKIHNNIPKKDFDQRVNLIPINRAAKPEEIIGMIYYLGSSMNTYTSCEVISVAGGE
jgi:3-oxoacyl-[acyl-carrier protein] reductase